MKKIRLTEEKETLLVPLYGKAKKSQKRKPILVDQKAIEIVQQIEYDFKSLKIPEKTNIMMSIRAKLIDDFAQKFLQEHPDGVVLHLGCGLDCRYTRIGNASVDWYDLDFPEVIEIRRHFFAETEHYHLLPSSVTEAAWLEQVPQGRQHYLVIAEGLLMYLREEEIQTLFRRLKERLGSYTLIFDAFSKFTAKHAGNHPSIKKTGAKIHWGLDDPQELTGWGIGLQFVEEKYFSDNPEIDKLGAGMRMMFKLANLFPVAKKAQRLFIYKTS